jgi:hypothetical protein
MSLWSKRVPPPAPSVVEKTIEILNDLSGGQFVQAADKDGNAIYIYPANATVKVPHNRFQDMRDAIAKNGIKAEIVFAGAEQNNHGYDYLAVPESAKLRGSVDWFAGQGGVPDTIKRSR